MIAYRAACDCGWTGPLRRREHHATADLSRHPEHPPAAHRCAACSALVALLVDDTGLCIRCDVLHHPAA